MMACSAFGRHISAEEALQTALALRPDKHFELAQSQESSLRKAPGKEGLYVFNASDSSCFVMIAGDDRVPALLAYSDRGILDPDNVPCNVAWMMDYYEQAISSLSESDGFMHRKADANPRIPQLLTTKWGQGEPYNLNCPVVNGSKCVTGCVATAMAQVINYHRWPEEEVGAIPGYVSGTHNISMNDLPPRLFNWENIGVTDVADLMRYAGQSVGMDYDPTASGAGSWMVSDALKNYFGFSRFCKLERREGSVAENWDCLIYAELKAGNPVLYFGQSPEGGHAFVVDGYADGLYHVNWGWEGYCDGYFSLDDLNPNMQTGFNFNHEIITSACPPGGTSGKGIALGVDKFGCDIFYLERSSATDDFPAFTINATLMPDILESGEALVGIALYDESALVKVLTEARVDVVPDAEVSLSESIIIDGGIAEGEYSIKAVVKAIGEESWRDCVGNASKYIAVSISGESMSTTIIPSNDDPNIILFGEHSINGITYELKSEFGNLRARFMNYDSSAFPDGILYIPDYVYYQNMRFDVGYNLTELWVDDFLSGISIPGCEIVNIGCCHNLTDIEVRGSIHRLQISNCDKLEKLILNYPCRDLSMRECPELKKLSLLCDNVVNIGWDWFLFEVPSLKDAYFKGRNIPVLFPQTEVNPNATIHVPSDMEEAYMQSCWKEWNIVGDLAPMIAHEIQYDYCGHDEDAMFGFATGAGSDDVEFAFRIPKSHSSNYIGNMISSIEYFTPNIAWNDPGWSDVEYVFIATPGSDYLTKQPVNTIRGQWVRVNLDTPVEITGEDLFIGIGRNGSLGVEFASEDPVDDGMWRRIMGAENYFGTNGIWDKGAAGASGQPRCYPLPIRAIITGDKLPNDVIVSKIEDVSKVQHENSKPHVGELSNERGKEIDPSDTDASCFLYEIRDGKYYAVANDSPKQKPTLSKSSAEIGDGETVKLNVTLRNRSPKIINRMLVGWDIDGEPQPPFSIDRVLLPNYSVTETISLDKEPLKGRNHYCSFYVKEIDGEPDTVDADPVDTVLPFAKGANQTFPRKFVMEEATATWCGWCPRGSAAIDSMKERYPENFIAIAVHDDEMYPADVSYDSFFTSISEFPSARLNREAWVDLAPFELENPDAAGEASISAEARFLENGSVEIKTSATFGFSDSGTEYRIAHVLAEDNVGPYFQYNYYSDPSQPNDLGDIMNWWVHQPSIVMMNFNNVARTISAYDGVRGLLPLEIEEGLAYESTYTLMVPDYVQNGSNLKVVALLIDGATGSIMNADETAIAGDSGVESLESGNEVNELFDVYTAAGIKVKANVGNLDNLPPGVYIINGKKIMLK